MTNSYTIPLELIKCNNSSEITSYEIPGYRIKYNMTNDNELNFRFHSKKDISQNFLTNNIL